MSESLIMFILAFSVWLLLMTMTAKLHKKGFQQMTNDKNVIFDTLLVICQNMTSKRRLLHDVII